MPQKLNPKYVEEALRELGFQSLSEYQIAIAPIKVECEHGHRFERSWHSFNGGRTTCPTCTGNNGNRPGHSTESAREYLKTFGYEMLSEYKGSHHKISYRCDHGHLGAMTWTNLQTGKRCPKCYRPDVVRPGTPPRESRESVKNRVRASFEDEGYALIDEYETAKSSLSFICPEGHRHQITWDAWQRGQRCGKCRRVDPSDVRKHFESEGYTVTSGYKNSKEKIRFICPNGHHHGLTWSSWNNGNRCAHCKGQVITTLQAEGLFKASGLILKDAYRNEKSSMKCWCVKGKHWHKESWRSLKKKGRCDICEPGASSFDDEKPGILYYVAFQLHDRCLYKIGITNGTVRSRFSREKLKHRILMAEPFLFGGIARAEESKILNKHKRHKYNGPRVLESGNTELFEKDVLRLDKCNA